MNFIKAVETKIINKRPIIWLVGFMTEEKVTLYVLHFPLDELYFGEDGVQVPFKFRPRLFEGLQQGLEDHAEELIGPFLPKDMLYLNDIAKRHNAIILLRDPLRIELSREQFCDMLRKAKSQGIKLRKEGERLYSTYCLAR